MTAPCLPLYSGHHQLPHQMLINICSISCSFLDVTAWGHIVMISWCRTMPKEQHQQLKLARLSYMCFIPRSRPRNAAICYYVYVGNVTLWHVYHIGYCTWQQQGLSWHPMKSTNCRLSLGVAILSYLIAYPLNYIYCWVHLFEEETYILEIKQKNKQKFSSLLPFWYRP